MSFIIDISFPFKSIFVSFSLFFKLFKHKKGWENEWNIYSRTSFLRTKYDLRETKSSLGFSKIMFDSWKVSRKGKKNV